MTRQGHQLTEWFRHGIQIMALVAWWRHVPFKRCHTAAYRLNECNIYSSWFAFIVYGSASDAVHVVVF